MDEVKQLRQRIQELEKELAEVHQIVLTHFKELRTPLTPIKGFVRTLLDDENEEWYTRDDRCEFYQIIDENVDRLGRILDGLIDFDRIKLCKPVSPEMNWQEVDVCKLIESVAAIQQERTDRHTLVIDSEPEQIFVETDPEKFQNILHNLIGNAIKYSPDGGEVRVTARLEPPNKEYPNGALLVQVKDQGMGMRKEDLKKVGYKFIIHTPRKANYHVDPGIGLFLVVNLVKAQHGVFWADSEGLCKGSTFRFRIPVKQPKEEGAEKTTS